MKLKYTHHIDSEEPVMLINKHIGDDEDSGEGIMGDQFQNELMYLDTLGKKRIQVHICSEGGSVLEGMKMYHAILASKTKVDTYNGGMAASIAGVIFQAGRKRYVYDNALLMMHNPYNPDGKVDSGLDAIKGSLITMLGRKTNKTEDEISSLMNATTWMNAEQCITNGFADERVSISDLNKPRATPITSENIKARLSEYTNFFNSIHTKKEPTMKKVANKLNLIESANEDAFVSAIDAIENKVTEAVAAKNALAVELEAAKTELATAANKVKELEAAATAAKEAADAEKLAALDKAAELQATNYAAAGKIKNDVASIAKVKAQLIKDFDGTKSLLDELPINKAGANIVNALEGNSDIPKYTMGAAMIDILNKTKQ
jgi:ATP-dependent protease ClpP protease subunit